MVQRNSAVIINRSWTTTFFLLLFLLKPCISQDILYQLYGFDLLANPPSDISKLEGVEVLEQNVLLMRVEVTNGPDNPPLILTFNNIENLPDITGYRLTDISCKYTAVSPALYQTLVDHYENAFGRKATMSKMENIYFANWQFSESKTVYNLTYNLEQGFILESLSYKLSTLLE